MFNGRYHLAMTQSEKFLLELVKLQQNPLDWRAEVDTTKLSAATLSSGR
jgi:hypothetical protein